MDIIREILATTQHRPQALPQKPWKYYQEWHGTLFLHWQIDAELLRPLLPDTLELDLFEGKAWVSVVLFSVKNMLLRPFPPLPPFFDFREANLRTYVKRDGASGIFMLSMESGKLLSLVMSRMFLGLHYHKAKMKREAFEFNLENPDSNDVVGIRYCVLPKTSPKTDLEIWLTERYSLFHKYGNSLDRLDIHHKPWDLKNIRIKRLQLHLHKGGLLLNSEPDLAHFAPLQQTLLWPKQKIR